MALMETTADYYGDEVRCGPPFMKPGLGRRLWLFYNPAVVAAAFLWRRILFRTTFIAVTGSSGKTTTKEFLYAILSSRHRSIKTRGSPNARYELPRTILLTRPRHRFVVAEIGIVEPGIMWRSALLFRPDIAVVLNINNNHIESFGKADTTAREKGKLVEVLGRRGAAILNGDDPRVAAMAKRTRGESVLWGASSGLDLWADQISSRWPERLSFRVHEGAESQLVRTRLVGRHWTWAALAAIAAARRCGISLKDCASAISVVPPFPVRMEPISLPSGATLLRDDDNGYSDTFDACLDVLRDHQGGRGILMISQLSGMKTREQNRLRHIANKAAPICDMCVFIGRKSRYASRRAMDAGMTKDQVRAFRGPIEAAEFLRNETVPSDLIVLKGRRVDRLGRVLSAIFEPAGG